MDLVRVFVSLDGSGMRDALEAYDGYARQIASWETRRTMSSSISLERLMRRTSATSEAHKMSSRWFPGC